MNPFHIVAKFCHGYLQFLEESIDNNQRNEEELDNRIIKLHYKKKTEETDSGLEKS